jgi:hypothetical protein
MKARPNALVWMGVAFSVAAALAVSVLAHLGVGKMGVEAALRLTARLAFLFFWPSYVGGALVALFGPALQPVKRRAREFGLAFASVLAVHLGLVAWLCWIGAAPSLRIFAIFGVGAVWTYLQALFSIERLGRAAGLKAWWILRNIGMNYIAFDFALDFLKPQHQASLLRLAEYLPFAAVALLGPLLRLLAWLKPMMASSAAADRT